LGASGGARVLQPQGNGYHIVGSMPLPSGVPFSKRIEQIERGEFKILAPSWNEVEIARQRLRVMPDNKPSQIP
jgi:hypothetical protein